MHRERLPRSALSIIKVSETKRIKISGRWIRKSSDWQTLIDKSGHHRCTLQLRGDWTHNALFLHLICSTRQKDRPHIPIYGLSHYHHSSVSFCCPWDFSLVIQLQSEFGKLHSLLQNHMSVISCSAYLLRTLGLLFHFRVVFSATFGVLFPPNL